MDNKQLFSLSRSLGVAAGALLAALLVVALVGVPGLPPVRAARENASAMPAGHDLASLAAADTFTTAVKADPVGLDPALTTDSNAWLVAAQIYETLVTYEPGGSLPKPGLALTWT
ncbi:MAG TPA: hypothetical protein VJ754_08140, partial [Anaerolineae bacterium]|nr:hypothetical protein [Anaerolineae bacterium]